MVADIHWLVARIFKMIYKNKIALLPEATEALNHMFNIPLSV